MAKTNNMFFIASKILSFLIDPFFWIIGFFLLATFSKKIYKRKRYFIIGLITLFIFSNSFIFKSVNGLWKINPELENPPKFDFGILLGGMISLNSDENTIKFNSNNDRLLNTIDLYYAKTIDKILITGASGSMVSDLIEADLIEKYLLDIGVPKVDIFKEIKSKNTFENAQFSEEIILNLGEKTQFNCLIITSDYHMRRSMACFYNTNLNVYPFTKKIEEKYFDFESFLIPQSNVLFQWKILSHEIIGYFSYKMMGYI